MCTTLLAGLMASCRLQKIMICSLKWQKMATLFTLTPYCQLIEYTQKNLSNREYWRIFEESIKVVSQHASTHRFFAKISSISWKGRYILATIRRTDWPRFLYLTVKPDYIFGLLFYVTLVRPCIYILRKSNKID